MTFETTVTRSERNGLQAETVIPLLYDRRELRITTCKRGYGGVSTTAQVVQVAEDGRSFTYVLFQDFNKRLAEDRTMRCTEKNLRTMHAQALQSAGTTLAEAMAKHPNPNASRAATDHAEECPESLADIAEDYLNDFNNPGSRHHY